MQKTRNVALVLIAASIGLAGCSDSEPSKVTANEGSTSQPEDGAGTEPEEGSNTPDGGAEPDEGTEPGEGTEPEGGSSAKELSASPATGEAIDNADFTFNLPEGWEESHDENAPEGLDIMAGNANSTGDFMENLNVIQSPAGAVALEVVETDGVDELKAANADEVMVNDRVIVAGNEVSHLTAELSTPVDYVVEQYYLAADDATRIITFSFGPDASESERTEVAESVLATWEWK